MLFRIIQESLNNAGKHAHAQMIWVALDLTSPAVVALSIRDDGVGFDPAMAGEYTREAGEYTREAGEYTRELDQASRRRHLGLKHMRERVEDLKGTFEVRSQLGSGTEIQVILPLTGEREA